MKNNPWDVDKSKVTDFQPKTNADGSLENASGSYGDDPKPVARFALDLYSCPKDKPLILVPIKPVKYLVDYMLVIRLADMGFDASGLLDMVMEGAKYFTVCGLPVARKDDGMQHKGVILSGSDNFKVGGPKFSLPENMKIGGQVEFKNNALRDLYALSTTPKGQELLDRIAAHGQPVTIASANGPGNANPEDRDAYNRGQPTGTALDYDPNKTNLGVEGTKPGTYAQSTPQSNLGHELAHAAHFGEGNGKPPPAQFAEEAAAVKDENELRKQLGLPARGKYGPWKDLDTNQNDRPGDCK